MSTRSKSPVKIHLEKNGLPGYTLLSTQKLRRSLLSKLADDQGWGTVVKKLSVLRLFNKNRYPEKAAKYHKDMKFVQTLSPKRQSKKPTKRHSTKKRSSKKRSSKKRLSKKRSSKKRSTKRRSSKKHSTKRRSSKKRSTKRRSSKKRSTKRRSNKKRSSKK